MYERHFGFSRPVFSAGVAQDEAVFRTAATAQLARDLEIALTRKDAVALLSGTSGTGKTTIAADALKRMGTRQAFACLSTHPLTRHELLEQLLTDFGFEPHRQSHVERLQEWRQFLSEMMATDTSVCLLVEAAENLSSEVLESLHSLTATDPTLGPGANVILTTTLPAEKLLVSPELLAFSQRVRLRRRIEPLSATELADYLEFKCRYADVDCASIFASDVPAALHEFSGGIIRVTDNLVETALIAAAASNEERITAEEIVRIAEEQFGLTRITPAEVDELLQESGTDIATSETTQSDDIPTLTEYVSV
jgi:general secretion pathway protein A